MIATDRPEGDPTHQKTPPPRQRSPETALRPIDAARFDERFASRASGIVSSVMRDLMSLAGRPEIISLAGGFPNTESFEREIFDEVAEVIARDHLASALQYGPTEGLLELRELIVEIMGHEGAQAGVEDIMVTSGGQQAIDLSIRTFVNPGDTVLAEGPTYPARSRASPPTRRGSSTSRWTRTACASTWWRRRSTGSTRRGAPAQAALHDPQLPQPGRRDACRSSAASA